MDRAIIIMLIGMSFIPAGDAASKVLSSQLGVEPLFISWSRFTIGALLVLPFMLRGGWGIFKNPWIWLRGAMIGAGISCIAIALQTTDLATAFGGLFFGPVVSFMTAAIFLREHVTLQRTILVIIGFIGVLMVTQPGLNVSTGAGFALLSGTFYGLFLTLSRQLAPNYKPLHLLFSQLFIASLLTMPFGIFSIPEFTPEITIAVFSSAIFSMTGNTLLIIAYTIAPATRMAPLVYFQLIAALILGWAIFGTLPNALGFLGLFVVASSGFATFILKR